MERIRNVVICIAVAWVAAMGMTLIMHFAYWPPRWNRIDADILFSIALLGAIYSATVPLIALGIVSLRHVPSTLLSVYVTCSWLFVLFLVRATRFWFYHGELATWMFFRDFIQQLPLSLAIGLAFGVAARRLLGPNNSFKPSPLRGLGRAP